jgi:trehalose 6-phosphate synthase/phosphatase
MLQGLKLLPEYINPAHQIGSGPILLDYGGTVMPQQLINEASSQELIFTLNGLFSDPQLAEWVTR